MDRDLLLAIMETESTFRPDAQSKAGAQGIMQLMPAMQRATGVNDPFDVKQNIQGGTRLLEEEFDRFGGDLSLSLAAYNAGSPAVRRAMKKARSSNFEDVAKFLPDETRNYVDKVKSRYARGFQGIDIPEEINTTLSEMFPGDTTGSQSSSFPSLETAKSASEEAVMELLPARSDSKTPQKQQVEASIPTYTEIKEPTLPEVSQGPNFSEEADFHALQSALNPREVARAQFQNLHKKRPDERARIGADFGTGVGMGIQGPVGAFFGAGMGAVLARAAGVVQTGEYEDKGRRRNVLGTLKHLGVASKDTNRISFEDGGESFPLLDDPNLTLQNQSNVIDTKATRSIYEVDKSNPFMNRALAAAKPLAHFLTEGMLGYREQKNPRDVTVTASTTNMLANALLYNVDTEEKLYKRAKELAKKMGVDQQKLRAFFDMRKNHYSQYDANMIRKGLDSVYTRNA